jgi:Histidine phosphatase superfamily (branch 1)
VQVLVVIRHGESEYNVQARSTTGWADPKIFDPSLTGRGCQQAMVLRSQLDTVLQSHVSDAMAAGSALWVTSPLRRCIQTLLFSCPLLPAPAALNEAPVQDQVANRLAKLASGRLPRIKITRCGDVMPGSYHDCCDDMYHECSVGFVTLDVQIFVQLDRRAGADSWGHRNATVRAAERVCACPSLL